MGCFDGRTEKNKRDRKNRLEFHRLDSVQLLKEMCFYYNQFVLLSTCNSPDKGKRHSPEKSLKSWKQILVELWTSHYFSVCLQTLSTVRTLSSPKGRNKGWCHHMVKPTFTASNLSFLFSLFSLFSIFSFLFSLFYFSLFTCLSQPSTTGIFSNFLPRKFILFILSASRAISNLTSLPQSKFNYSTSGNYLHSYFFNCSKSVLMFLYFVLIIAVRVIKFGV